MAATILRFWALLACVLLAVQTKAETGNCSPADHVRNSVFDVSDFPHCLKLGEGVVIRWDIQAMSASQNNFGSKEIVLAGQFPTDSGWVGLGFGQGSMLGSDIVSVRKINDKWVSEDRLGVSTATPGLDAQQDFKLLSAEAKIGYTWFKVSRAVTTCDQAGGDWDFDFTGETPVIWAFGSSHDFEYHGMKRGIGLVRFMDNTEGRAQTKPGGLNEIDIKPNPSKCPTPPRTPPVRILSMLLQDSDAAVPASSQEGKVMAAFFLMTMVGIGVGYAAGRMSGRTLAHDHASDANKAGSGNVVKPVERDHEGPVARYQNMDGMRGAGVLCVMFYHMGWSAFANAWMFSGFVFSMSGLLITDVTVRVLERKGSVELVAFWARRMARLFPALLLVVAIISLQTMLSNTGIFGEGQIRSPQQLFLLRFDLLWAIGCGENVHFAASANDYFSNLEKASIVRHLWSVAIEEQYYIVWPILFITWTSLLFPVSSDVPSTASTSPSLPSATHGKSKEGAEMLHHRKNEESDGDQREQVSRCKDDDDGGESGTGKHKDDAAARKRQSSLSRSLKALACGELFVLVFSYVVSLGILESHGPSAAYSSTLTRCGELAAGGLVYIVCWLNPCVHNRYKHLPGLPAMSNNMRIILEVLVAAPIILLLGSAIMAMCGVVVDMPFYFQYIRMPLSLLLAVLTVPGALQLSEPLPKWAIVSKFFTSKVMVFLGATSYTIYLLHWPLVWWFSDVEGDVFSADSPDSGQTSHHLSASYATLRDIAIAVACIAMASAQFLWLEKPVMQAARGKKPLHVIGFGVVASVLVACLVIIATWNAEDPSALDRAMRGDGLENSAAALSFLNMLSANASSSNATLVVKEQIRASPPAASQSKQNNQGRKTDAKASTSKSGSTTTSAEDSTSSSSGRGSKEGRDSRMLAARTFLGGGKGRDMLNMWSKSRKYRSKFGKSGAFTKFFQRNNMDVGDTDEAESEAERKEAPERKKVAVDTKADVEVPSSQTVSKAVAKPVSKSTVKMLLAGDCQSMESGWLMTSLLQSKTHKTCISSHADANDMVMFTPQIVSYASRGRSLLAKYLPWGATLNTNLRMASNGNADLSKEKPDILFFVEGAAYYVTKSAKRIEVSRGNSVTPAHWNVALANLFKDAMRNDVKHVFWSTPSPFASQGNVLRNQLGYIVPALKNMTCDESKMEPGQSFLHVSVISWHVLICPTKPLEEMGDACPRSAHGFSSIMRDKLHARGDSGAWLVGQLLSIIFREYTKFDLGSEEKVAQAECFLSSYKPDNQPPLETLIQTYKVCVS